MDPVSDRREKIDEKGKVRENDCYREINGRGRSGLERRAKLHTLLVWLKNRLSESCSVTLPKNAWEIGRP
jgi:hypothetical protein